MDSQEPLLLFEIVITFITKKTDSFQVSPIRMAILNLEITDRAVLVIPHAFYKVEFLFIVITTIIW